MLKFKKITTFLLLTAFLATGFGNAFGFVYCDSGCFSETHHENHHHDESHEAIGEDFAIPLGQQMQGSADSCLDYQIKMIDGVVKKNDDFKVPASAAILSNFAIANNLPKTYLHICTPYHLSPRTVSQTILVHRTVVLLA